MTFLKKIQMEKNHI